MIFKAGIKQSVTKLWAFHNERCQDSLAEAREFSLAYIQGEVRGQHTLFPSTLDDLIPADHVCRVIEEFVGKLQMEELGFVRSEPAETGRPGYDPRDLLKLYLYGYLHQVRSSRRLEAECRRNVEVMWLLGRLTPDYKSIAEFRRMHRDAVTKAGAELVRFARQVGLVRGEWVAIDGSKFRAVASPNTVRERDAVKRYLDQLESADEQDEIIIDPSAVAAALEKLRQDPEPEARFMRMAPGHAPAYNVQTAVDTERGIIIAQQVTTEATDNRSLLPMAEAAKQALDNPATLNVVADAGYSNGEQAERCEEQGILPHAPANRAVNNQGDHTLFDRTLFIYDEKTDTFRCPAAKILTRKQLSKKDRCVMYAAPVGACDKCPLKQQCTSTTRRWITRHLHEGALQRMNARANKAAMRLRRCTVERPFAMLKYVIFGHPRFLLRGLGGAQTEISLATLAYNLKTMINAIGTAKLIAALA
jgi:transposase